MSLYPMFLRKLLLASFIMLSSLGRAQEVSPETLVYFKEVALGSEYSHQKSPPLIQKWKENPRMYVTGEASSSLTRILREIVEELNQLVKPLQIEWASSRQEANFVIFLGSAQEYVQKYEPACRPWIRNLALFYVRSNAQYEIYEGSMYLDTQRLKAMDTRKHLLREELTQALGLMKDSPRYRDSIFYSKFTRTQSFSEMDRKLIRLLYNPKVRPGMNAQDLDSVLSLK